MPDVTRSARPTQEQVIKDIRNLRKDLDAIEQEANALANIVGLSEVGGALVNSAWRAAEARMWLGRTLELLGETNTGENHDKATEARESLAPSRRTSPAEGESDEGKGK